MALRYHWGLGISHTYSRQIVYSDIGGLGPVVQSVESCEDADMHLKSYSNRSGSTAQAENNSIGMDIVVDDEAAELTLVEREALDWEEDSDSEESEKINRDCTSGDERDDMDMYDELGSDPEWIDMED